MDTPAKTFLLISRVGPCGSSQAREALDIAFATAAFNQDLQLVFMDDGVLQLLKGQQPTAGKTLENTLGMLEHYGITQVYVEGSSLMQRGLTVEDLALDCTIVDGPAIGQLITAAGTTLGG